MNRFLTIATVLTLAVSGTTMLTKGLQADDQIQPADSSVQTKPGQTNDKTNAALGRAGDSANRASDVNSITDSRTRAELEYRLASLVNSAVSVNGFDDMVGSLARPDRERIGSDRYKDFSALNAALEQFNKDFRAKYNEDFDVKAEQFDRLQFQQAGNDRVTVSLSDLKGNRPATGDLHGQSNYQERTGSLAARREAGDASVVYGDHVTANDSLREYNIRGRDKRPLTVVVSEVKPDGRIVCKDIPEDRIHNADIVLRPSDRFGWWLPEVVASNTPRIQPDGAHEGLDGNNYVMTQSEVETAAYNPDSSRDIYARANENTNTESSAVNYSGTGIHSSYRANDNPQPMQTYSMTGTDNTTTVNPPSNTGNAMSVTSPTDVSNRDATPTGTIQTENSSQLNGVASDVSIMPGQLNLVREGAIGNGWRLDIADTITAQQLADNLTQRIKKLSENKANWPDNVNEAYRVVSRKVFEAVTTAPDEHLTLDGQ